MTQNLAKKVEKGDKKRKRPNQIDSNSSKILESQNASAEAISSMQTGENDHSMNTQSSSTTNASTDFPRGGVSSNLDQCIRHPEQDLFKTSRSNKKRKVEEVETANAAPKERKWAQTLKFNNLSVGMLLLGAIREIGELELVVSLPNQLTGHVAITEISDVISQQVEKFAQIEDLDDESIQVDKDVPELPNLRALFRVGQLVPCAIINIVSPSSSTMAVSSIDSSNHSSLPKKRIDLSLKPKLVNQDITVDNLVDKMTICGAVLSVEDHGYVIDLGINQINGFLHKNKAKNYVNSINGGKDLVLGQIIECAIDDMKPNAKRTIPLTLEPEIVYKSVPKSLENVTFDALKPGALVNAKVKSVLTNGFLVKFHSSAFEGTVDHFHIESPSFTMDDQVIEKYQQKAFKARILWVDNQNKTVGLTTRKHLLEWKAASFPDQLEVGTILEKVVVKRFDDKSGCLCLIPNEAKIAGYAHLPSLSDSKLSSAERVQKFKEGSKHRCRILRHDTIDGLLNISFQKSILNMPFLRLQDLKVGSSIKATVNKVESYGIVVSITDNLRGLVPSLHLADVMLTHPELKYKPGKSYTFKVLSVDVEQRRVQLTAKKSLINSILPIIQSYTDAQTDMITQGVVTSLQSYGIIVTFWNNVRGLVHISELSNQFVNDPKEVVKLGQVVKCRVIESNPEDQKLKLSLNLIPRSLSALKMELPEIGSFVNATVIDKSKKDSAIICQSASGTKVILTSPHLSDHISLSHLLFNKVTVGQTFQELLVIRRSVKEGVIYGSDKPLLKLAARAQSKCEVGDVSPGWIKAVTDYGCFVEMNGGISGLVPTRLLSDDKVASPQHHVSVGQTVLVKIVQMDQETNRVEFSMKSSDVAPSLPQFISPSFYLQSYFNQRDNHVDNLNVPSVTDVKVTKVIENGFECSLKVGSSNGVTGHIVAGPTPNPELKADEKVKARVLDVDFSRKIAHLSINPVLLKSSKQNSYDSLQRKVRSDTTAVIELIEDDYIVVSLPDFGNLIGFVSPNNFNSKTNSFDKFKVGQTITVEVSYAPITPTVTDRIILSFPSVHSSPKKSKKSNSKLLSGDIVSVIIRQITSSGLHVTIPSHPALRGHILPQEAATTLKSVSSLSDSFTPGQTLQAQIVAQKSGFVELSLRSLEDGEIITWDNIKEGQNFIAKIVDVDVGVGLRLQINSVVSGRVHVTDILDEFTDFPLNQFRVGDYVEASVVGVSKKAHQLDLSLRSRKDTISVESLKIGDIVRGYVKSVSGKGVFINLGRKLDGKVKLCNLADTFVKNLNEKFKSGQVVNAKVISLEPTTNHVELSLKKSDIDPSSVPKQLTLNEINVGDKLAGKVTKIESYGIFIKIDDSKLSGLCHKSELSDQKISDISKLYQVGDQVKAVVLKVDTDKKRISFGLKSSYFENDDVESGVESDSSDFDMEMNEAEGISAEEESDDQEDEEDEEISDEMDVDESDDLDSEGDAQESEDDAPEVIDEGDAPALDIGGFDWNADLSELASESDSESDSDSDSEQTALPTSLKKSETDKEKEIAALEKSNLQSLNRAPETHQDYERLLIGSPNSSFLWIKYMAFELKLSEVERAREIAKRALKTIHYREEVEKLNVWVAWLNLENQFGDEQSLQKVVEQAVVYNDPKTIYMHLANMYTKCEKFEAAEATYETMLKKFRQSSKVWSTFGLFYYQQQKSLQLEKARQLLQKSLQSLPSRKHVKTMLKFAQMEFKFGEPERGRTLFEGMVSNYPKRVDLWNVYIDMEIKAEETEKVRSLTSYTPDSRLFDRVTTSKFSSKKMKFFFKKFLEFEKKFGDEDRIEYVKQKAIEYVESLGQ
ncbi:hypothetical protein BKA69DRAFT_1037920 [Paraphysoderma sedebokerense]|nr:hypothetical protein BKA69DRAFT_1037920 [Paraphysoderma sedebokerense]